MDQWVGTIEDIDRYIKDDLHYHIKVVIQIWWAGYTPFILKEYQGWITSSSTGIPKNSDEIERAWQMVIQGILCNYTMDSRDIIKLHGE